MPLLPAALAVALAMVPVAGVPVGVPVVASAGCEVSDATLSWGFKASFRAYIDGDIANGEWTTAGGATYSTPDFGWSGGTGSYDPETGEGLIAFTGSVRFTGHDGLLDTTIADPSVRLDGDGGGVLLLDVSGPTMNGDQIDQQDVEFVAIPALRVAGDDAVRTIDADTALTPDGAVAFPNYEAGTAFDPVAISLTVGKGCAVAAVDGDVVPARDGAGLVALLIGGGVLVAAAVVVVVVITRCRRA